MVLFSKVFFTESKENWLTRMWYPRIVLAGCWLGVESGLDRVRHRVTVQGVPWITTNTNKKRVGPVLHPTPHPPLRGFS